jgi:cold shock protein
MEWSLGTVKFFDDHKGWGFVIPDNGRDGAAVFVHRNNLDQAGIIRLDAGQRVRYIAGKDRSGRPAVRGDRIELAEPFASAA